MKVYFMGICGTAMGHAALLAKAAGHEVSGSDAGIYPPMSDVLRAADITIQAGYDPQRLAALAPDLVVVGNALSRGNPEIEWLLETRALRFTSLPALLAETALRGRRNLVIAGTHGKTTTTSLTAFLLRANATDPGFLIGGVPLDPPMGQHLGDPAAPFVIEGDEYDSAFFDKRSKFIHYAPHIAAINNLEFDHADIFRDLADVQRTFRHLTRLIPRQGWLLLNGDDPNLAEFRASPWTQVATLGSGADHDLQIVDFAESPADTRFTLVWRGKVWATVAWAMPGLFNARNAATAALTAGLALHPHDPTQLSLDSLARFRGVKRRQEVKFERKHLIVIEDFGHHPTALAATLTSLRARYPGHLLTAVFEPRSNSARTQVHQAGFIAALAVADAVFLGAVNRADALVPDQRFDSEAVIAALAGRNIPAQTAPTNRGLLTQLNAIPSTEERPRIVAFFTNGSFDGIIEDFVTQAATA